MMRIDTSVSTTALMEARTITSDVHTEDYALDGRAPDDVLVPSGEEEAVDVVRQAAADHRAIVPWGGATAIMTGNRLLADRWAALDTRAMHSVIDYSPDDMVVTVQTGVTMRALADLLAPNNQFLPLDVADDDRATIGGVTATNAQGLLRPLYGLPRDRLLGARVVLGDGTVVRGGGKVVKNVAGYDLCKLIAGSWGTLGLITEVTYKTNPIPPAQTSLRFGGKDLPSLASAALEIHAARLQPAYLVLTGPDNPALTVGLMGSAEAVQWQGREITQRLCEAGLSPVTADAENDLRLLSTPPSGVVQARVNVRPTEVPAALTALEPIASALVGHIVVGLIEMAVDDGVLAGVDESQAPRWDESIRTRLPRHAHLVWTRVPDAWKATVDVWGLTRPDFFLMRGIKAAFDARGIFSPGRFVGRI